MTFTQPPKPSRPARLGSAQEAWNRLAPSLSRQWTFHLNPQNPGFPPEILSRILTFFILDQPSLHCFEPRIVPQCIRGCDAFLEHCDCHFHSVNVVELVQAMSGSKHRYQQQTWGNERRGGFSPSCVIRQLGRAGAATARVATNPHKEVVRWKGIKKRTFDQLDSPDVLVDPLWRPIGEFPTHVKENDVVYLHFPDYTAKEERENLWFHREDLPIAFGSKIRGLRRVAMSEASFSSMSSSDLISWTRNMDRYHLWQMCFDRETSMPKDIEQGAWNPLLPSDEPPLWMHAWRPEGLYLWPQAGMWSNPFKLGDPRFRAFIGRLRPFEQDMCAELEQLEHQRAITSARKRRDPRPQPGEMGDAQKTEGIKDLIWHRTLLWRGQMWWESLMVQWHRRWNSLMLEEGCAAERYLHDVLTSCEEFYIVMEREALEDDQTTTEYMETYDPGVVAPGDTSEPAERVCVDCQYAHPNKPLRFGGMKDHEYVEVRVCRPDLFGSPDDWGSSTHVRRRFLENWARISWHDGEPAFWPIPKPTSRPIPQLRFLQHKRRKPVWTTGRKTLWSSRP